MVYFFWVLLQFLNQYKLFFLKPFEFWFFLYEYIDTCISRGDNRRVWNLLWGRLLFSSKFLIGTCHLLSFRITISFNKHCCYFEEVSLYHLISSYLRLDTPFWIHDFMFLRFNFFLLLINCILNWLSYTSGRGFSFLKDDTHLLVLLLNEQIADESIELFKIWPRITQNCRLI